MSATETLNGVAEMPRQGVLRRTTAAARAALGKLLPRAMPAGAKAVTSARQALPPEYYRFPMF